jgi:hypothetical protein
MMKMDFTKSIIAADTNHNTKLHTRRRYNPESTKLTFKEGVITDEGQRKHSTYSSKA